MIEIARETDIETLRQVAQLLDRENQRLLSRLADVQELIAKLCGADSKNAQLALDLLEQVIVQRQLIFDVSRENEDGESPAKAGTPDTSHDGAQGRQKCGHGPRKQDRLPWAVEDHTLAETERICDQCGGVTEEMEGQFEESIEITVRERTFIKIRHRRQKYRCCCNGKVLTAPGPVKLIPGGRYSPEFAIEVATGKYLDHLPLERQARIMRREGLEVSSQVLWDQLDALANHLWPSYQALKTEVLNAPVIFADETRWRFMEKGRSRNWFVWCIASEDSVFYQIFDNRSNSCARELLTGYQGVVMADGYIVYESVSGAADSGFLLAHCWAHVVRKFKDLLDTDPESCQEVLELIRGLYKVEDAALAVAAEGDLLEVRRELRAELSRPIVDEIKAWAVVQMSTMLPQSDFGKAIGYLFNMWDGLTLFLDHPEVPLDNNPAERVLRGVVVGRKNHYGSRSRRGTEVAAAFYSLFETAKLRDVEGRAYLLQATRAALAAPGTVTLPSRSPPN